MILWTVLLLTSVPALTLLPLLGQSIGCPTCSVPQFPHKRTDTSYFLELISSQHLESFGRSCWHETPRCAGKSPDTCVNDSKNI